MSFPRGWSLLGCFLFACGERIEVPVGGGVLSTGTDTGEAAAEGRWTIGEAEDCSTPQDGLSWKDVSAGVQASPVGDHDAPMALVEEAGSRSIIHTDALLSLVQRRLGDGVEEARVTFPDRVHSFSVVDLDGDGARDLVVSTDGVYVVWSFGKPEQRTESLRAGDLPSRANKVVPTDLDHDGLLDLLIFVTDHEHRANMQPERIFNRGGQTWSACEPVGPSQGWGQTFDVRMLDMDGDQEVELYICNDDGAMVQGNLLVQSDGDGNIDIGAGQGLDITTSCMGTAFGDPNADGRLDAWVGALDRHYLLLQSEEGGHYDAAASWGLEPFVEGQMAWGGALVDLDNDGREDLVAATADFPDVMQGLFPLQLFLQAEGGGFVPLENALIPAAGPRGVLARDLNMDGALDLVVSDMTRSPWVFFSEGCTAGSWVEIEAPTGAVVRVWSGGTVRAGLASAEPTFGTTGPSVVHFGLGEADQIDAIEIIAPGSGKARLEGPISGRRRLRWTPAD